MTDKVQKIKDWISKEQDGLMDAQGNFEYPEHEGAYHILCNLDAYIDSLQEESVSIWHDASEKPERDDLLIETNDGRIIHRQSINNYGMVKRWAYTSDLLNLDNSYSLKNNLQEEHISEFLNTESMIESYKQRLISQANGVNNSPFINMCLASYKHGINETLDTLNLSNVVRTVKNWKGEPVSEGLGNYINELSKQFPEVSFAKLSRIAVRVAKWQKEHLWKSADGNDLPEIDREVVAFQEIFPIDVDVPSLLKIVIAHRPNPEGYDGKSFVTGEVEHYTPKTYDKGGWNIPDVKWWLDVELPKEIEL